MTKALRRPLSLTAIEMAVAGSCEFFACSRGYANIHWLRSEEEEEEEDKEKVKERMEEGGRVGERGGREGRGKAGGREGGAAVL